MDVDHESGESDVIQLPASTAWPMVLALGISLIFAGMVTHFVLGLLGAILTVYSSIGWFFQVLPHEAHTAVPVEPDEVKIASIRTLMERPDSVKSPRLILPVETFRIATGIKGGIAGGVAMTIPATLFSIFRYHSVWYAMNLLAAGGFLSWAGASDAFLGQFHLQGLLAALAIHGVTSLLVGLLYGAMLPMFPRLPIVTAGLMAPIIFTLIFHSVLGILSPILNQRIDWFWFVISQVAYGLVCGFVVNLHERIRTPQFRALPFVIRAGIHSGGSTYSSGSKKTSDEKDNTE